MAGRRFRRQRIAVVLLWRALAVAVVRMVAPDGTMRVVESGETLLAPARVAYAPASGWLYVTDAADDKLVALNVPGLRPRPRPTALLGGAR